MPEFPDTVRELRAAGCVFAEDEARLLIEAGGNLDALLARRVAGEPLEHIVGWVDFDGLRVRVGAGVFVPRQRTRLLARQAISLLRPGMTLVEMCCGAAAVASLAAARTPGIGVHACDIDPVAVEYARANLGQAGVVHRGDLFAALPGDLAGRIDVLAANAPYVPTDEIATMPPEARDHEPATALDGGPDGVDVHRRIAAEVSDWLAPAGSVLAERAQAQAALTAGALAGAGLRTTVRHDDDLAATVVIGTADERRA